MNYPDNKKIIQDTYDRGEFCGLSFTDGKIGLSVKNKKHWNTVFLKSEVPLKEFTELTVFVSELGKPKKSKAVVETN